MHDAAGCESARAAATQLLLLQRLHAGAPPANVTPRVTPANLGMDTYARSQPLNPGDLAQIYAANPFLVNEKLYQQGVRDFALLPPLQQAQVQQAAYVHQQTMWHQAQAIYMQQQQALMGRPIAPYGYPANYQVPPQAPTP